MKIDIIQKSIGEFLKTFTTEYVSYDDIQRCYDEARYRCINSEQSFKIEIFERIGAPVTTYTLKESLLGNHKWSAPKTEHANLNAIALFLLVHYVRDTQKEPTLELDKENAHAWLATVYQTYL